MSQSLEFLQQSRSEERWNVESGGLLEVEEALSQYEHIQYEKPWVTTIYFAGVKDGVDGNEIMVPLRDVKVSLKARQFNSHEHKDSIKILKPEDEYRFEAKLRPLHEESSSRRRKYITTAPLKLINKALFSGVYDDSTVGSNFPSDLLPAVLNRMGCKRFVPIGLVQYLRSHYINDGKADMSGGQRITLDTNFTIWDIDWTGYCYAASLVTTSNQGVLEVKNQGGTQRYPDILSSMVAKLPLAQSKHDLLFASVKGNLGMQVEVEQNHQDEGWMINERELKVDVNSDPRDWLRNFNPQEKFALTDADEQSTRQQFFMLGDETKSACVMEYLTIKRTNQIKAKKRMDGSDSYQSRVEFAKPDTEANRQKVSDFLGVDISNAPMSPKFERRRVLRTLINMETGRAFEITADSCVSEDGRPSLNQVEVEYVGTHTAMMDSGSNGELDLEIRAIRELIISDLHDKSCGTSPSQTTKGEWICG